MWMPTARRLLVCERRSGAVQRRGLGVGVGYRCENSEKKPAFASTAALYLI